MINPAAVGTPEYDTMPEILSRAFSEISRAINATIEPIASDYEKHVVVNHIYGLQDQILTVRNEMTGLALRLANQSDSSL